MTTFALTGRRAAGLAAAVAVAATLAGCGSSSSRVQTYPTVHNATINGQRSMESIWVNKGQSLTLRLPTVGESVNTWRLSPASADNDLVSLEQRMFQRSPSGGPAGKGQPAHDIFTFKAHHSGQVSLEFIYDDAFSDTYASSRFVLHVDVTPGSGTSSVASAEQ